MIAGTYIHSGHLARNHRLAVHDRRAHFVHASDLLERNFLCCFLGCKLSVFERQRSIPARDPRSGNRSFLRLRSTRGRRRRPGAFWIHSGHRITRPPVLGLCCGPRLDGDWRAHPGIYWSQAERQSLESIAGPLSSGR